jgi:hypothetical protein
MRSVTTSRMCRQFWMGIRAQNGRKSSGRLPILLFSRSPTTLLPVGRGFGHGRAAVAVAVASTAPDLPLYHDGELCTVNGNLKSSVRQCIPTMAPLLLQELSTVQIPFSSRNSQRYRFRKLNRNGRPPPKARFVLCHYRQPHSWHEIAATCTVTVTADELGSESVVSTTVGSCQGSLKWAGIQPTLCQWLLCTQLRLAVFNIAR